MRKIICSWWLLVLLVPGVRGESPNAAFAAANASYEAGEMEKALAQYTALAKRISNWKIQYNMGNCLFKLNRFVGAKIHYLRALKLAPTRREIRQNLEMVNRRLGDEDRIRPRGFLASLWNRLLYALPMTLISILLLTAVFVFNGFLMGLILRGKSKWRIYGMVFFLSLALMMAGIQGVRAQHLDRRDRAVVIQPQAQLRSGPGTGHTVLFTLRPGLDVRVLERRAQWIQVSAASDIAGWISLKSVEII